jgi:hypothetical protein
MMGPPTTNSKGKGRGKKKNHSVNSQLPKNSVEKIFRKSIYSILE